MVVRKVKYNKNSYTAFDFNNLWQKRSTLNKPEPRLFIEKDTTRIITALPIKSGNTYFLIDIDHIEIVLPPRKKFHNDSFPKMITGLIAYENTFIPCINPGELCHFPQSNDGNCFVILSDNNLKCALECDFVRFPVKLKFTKDHSDLLFHKTKYEDREFYFLNAKVLFDLIKELEIE